MRVEEARHAQAIPCGLLEGATVTAPIKKNELITAKNVAINESQWIAKLRKEQDRLIYGQV